MDHEVVRLRWWASGPRTPSQGSRGRSAAHPCRVRERVKSVTLAHARIFTIRLSFAFSAGRTPSPACDTPTPGAAVRDSTRQLQTEQNTELVIHYGWHPWAGKQVQVVQLIQRGSEPSLRVECLIGRRVRRVDIPGWMFDRATCVIMVARDEPFVSFESLTALRGLLSAVVGRLGSETVEQEHLLSPLLGDAHEKTSPAKPKVRTTRAVRGKNKTPNVGKSVSRSKTTNQRTDRADAP